jgi:hypothetical protein
VSNPQSPDQRLLADKFHLTIAASGDSDSLRARLAGILDPSWRFDD